MTIKRLIHRLSVALSLSAAAWLMVGAREPGAPRVEAAGFSVGILVAAAVAGAAAWWSGRSAETVPFEDAGWPSLGSLAGASAVLVGIQVVLGACYRHQVIGLMAHVVGALLVAIVVLIAAVSILTQAAIYPALRQLAMTFAGLAFLQVVLGIGAYIGRASESPEAWMTWLAPAHAVVGAATLGAVLALWIEIRKNVRRPGSAAGGGRVEPLEVA